jgi:FixJ family two-component response regulator
MVGSTGSRFVAIVDDDRSLQRALKDLMESAGLAARCYGSAEEFLESDLCDQTGCLVLDILMPGMSGLELQAKLNALGSRIPIILITARGDAKLKTRAMKAGAVEFLSKPFDDDVLLETVRAALRGSTPSRE